MDTSNSATPTSSSPATGRTAKRTRERSTDSFKMAPSSPSDSDSEVDSDEYVPKAPPKPPAKRGRKSAPAATRSTREALRKSNHSIIEKRRREKINDALSTLKELIPPEDPQPQSKGKGSEKEFKLEILERTVAYVRKLAERVQVLEGGACIQTGSPNGRQVAQETDNAEEMEGVEVTQPATSLPQQPPPEMPQQMPQSSDSTNWSTLRLPPISSLLSFDVQLPSPPYSTYNDFPLGHPPALKLPSPASKPIGHPSVPRSTPSLSVAEPGWSKDEEAAASLLLQISSTEERHREMFTPASLLGLRQVRSGENWNSSRMTL